MHSCATRWICMQSTFLGGELIHSDIIWTNLYHIKKWRRIHVYPPYHALHKFHFILPIIFPVVFSDDVA